MILKSIKFVVFSVIIIGHANSLQSSFKQSKKQDLLEVFQYAQQQNPEVPNQQIKDFILGMSTATSKQNRIMSLQDLKKNVLHSSENQTVAEQIQDVLDTFEILKKLMHIPAEVEILFLDDDVEDVLYNVFDRTVYISPRFFGDIPTKRLFKLIHELTHVQQHLKLGIIPMINGTNSVEHEHQADDRAAQTISCPTCMQLIADDFPLDKNRAKLGYLTKADIIAYQKQKRAADTCDAHKLHTQQNQQLQALLTDKTQPSNIFRKARDWWQADKKSLQRAALDFSIGSITDRLSTIKLP